MYLSNIFALNYISLCFTCQFWGRVKKFHRRYLRGRRLSRGGEPGIAWHFGRLPSISEADPDLMGISNDNVALPSVPMDTSVTRFLTEAEIHVHPRSIETFVLSPGSSALMTHPQWDNFHTYLCPTFILKSRFSFQSNNYTLEIQNSHQFSSPIFLIKILWYIPIYKYSHIFPNCIYSWTHLNHITLWYIFRQFFFIDAILWPF